MGKLKELDYGHKGTTTGYSVLSFTDPEFTKLAENFHCYQELARCLIWLKEAAIINGVVHVPSRGIHDYILMKPMWKAAMKKAFPQGGIRVSPYQSISGRLMETDQVDKNGNPKNGLIILLEGKEHNQVCRRLESHGVQEGMASAQNGHITAFA